MVTSSSNSQLTSSVLRLPQLQKAFFGHKQQRNYLESLLKKNCLPTTLLFSGPSSVGKATLAYQLASCLVNRFTSFAQLAEENGTLDSPAIHLCQSQAGSNLKIDDVRAVQNFLWLRQPHSAGPRVVVVDAASDLQPNAQSVLLKTLEEPKEQSYFILINQQPSKLLATIQSRCHHLQFGYLAKDELRLILSSLNLPHEALANFVLASGNVNSAWLVAADQGSRYQEVLDLATLALRRPPSHHRTLLSMFKSGDELKTKVQEVGRLLDLVLQRSYYFLFAHELLETELIPSEHEKLALVSELVFNPASGKDSALEQLLQTRQKLHRALYYSKTIDLEPEQTLIYFFALLKHNQSLANNLLAWMIGNS